MSAVTIPSPQRRDRCETNPHHLSDMLPPVADLRNVIVFALAGARYAAELPTPFSTMHMYPMDGAVHRVAPEDTAFSYRDANWNQVIVGVDPDPANRDRMIDWTRRYYNAIHPYSEGGAYVNFLMGDEGSERVRATYRGNYARLVDVKRRYDPDNRFRINQNIAPDRTVTAAPEAAPPM